MMEIDIMYKCEYCKYKTYDEGDIEAHIVTEHPDMLDIQDHYSEVPE